MNKILKFGFNEVSYDILTDSASNLTEDLLDRYNIRMASYVSSVNGQNRLCFERGRDDAAEGVRFYNAMRNGAEVSTTLINSCEFMDFFTPSLKAGRDILFIGMSGGLTGTVQSARLAADELLDEYPDRRIICIDSMSASLGEGLLVIKMSRLRAAGATLEEAAQYYENHKMKMNHIFTVDDLKYLKKGGRISAAAAAIGSLLSIKPILKADDNGKIILHDKVRSRKRAIEYLINMVSERIVAPQHQTIGIAHCDAPEESAYIAERLKKGLHVQDVIVRYYDLCTGAHVGPGTIAIFFMGNDRCGSVLTDQSTGLLQAAQ